MSDPASAPVGEDPPAVAPASDAVPRPAPDDAPVAPDDAPAAPDAASGPLPVPVPVPVPVPSAHHARCGWIGGGETIGENSFIAHAREYTAIHPKWYSLEPDGVTVRNAGHTNLASVLLAAKAAGVRVHPLIDADDVARIRAMITDPAKRAAHVKTLVALVTQNHYAGLDIDYEHLWSAADRAPFSAFMQELAGALHAVGAEISLALPGLGYDGANAYDYALLARTVDALHVMGYDFHYLGSHAGPLAPSGWIDAVFQRAQSTGHPEKFILGLANYAIGPRFFTTTADALTRCSGPVIPTTDHMTVCPFDRYEAGRAPHCASAEGALWFEDLASMEEKMAIAKRHGAGGVTYWTVGHELPGYYALARRLFP